MKRGKGVASDKPKRKKRAPDVVSEATPLNLSSSATLEEVARSIAERTLIHLVGPGEHLRKLVDTHWQTTARELRAGLIDAQGNILTSRFVSQAASSDVQEASGRSRRGEAGEVGRSKRKHKALGA